MGRLGRMGTKWSRAPQPSLQAAVSLTSSVSQDVSSNGSFWRLLQGPQLLWTKKWGLQQMCKQLMTEFFNPLLPGTAQDRVFKF